ncbi:hypothetical protein PSOS111911_19050 [Pseudoalteromonas ostreae]
MLLKPNLKMNIYAITTRLNFNLNPKFRLHIYPALLRFLP